MILSSTSKKARLSTPFTEAQLASGRFIRFGRGALLRMFAGFVFALLFLWLSALYAQADENGREYAGELSIGAQTLRLNLKIISTDSGYEASLESVDQAAGQWIKASSVKLKDGEALDVKFKSIGASYEANWNAADEAWSGRWRQGGAPYLLIFRIKPPPNRPQTPQPPFPYQTEDVRFRHEVEPAFNLAGTLTYPSDVEPAPAIILLTGSGKQDRDETIFEHKPFAVLADALTRQGYAVLRYDDRGAGDSDGTYSGSTTDDFARDAKAAFDFLSAHSNIDKTCIGYAGHSEGGWVAGLAAQNGSDPDFMILLATPGQRMKETLLYQIRGLKPDSHMSDARRAEDDERIRNMYDAAASAQTAIQARADVEAALDRRTLKALGAPRSNKPTIVKTLTAPWMRRALQLDPVEIFGGFEKPVLILGGKLDSQVETASALSAFNEIFADNSNVLRRSFPHLNHLFQTAETGRVAEYRELEETMSPRVWETIDAWMSSSVPCAMGDKRQ